MEKFKNKYRIPSSRLQTWDYGSNGSYFITICTKDREHFFGEIVDREMQLNDIGKIAEQYWGEISNHFSYIQLGNFVVMPNHVHGILIIDKPNSVDGNGNTVVALVETLQCNVSTNATNATTATNANKNEQMAKISPKSGTISTIVRSYKSAVSKNAHLIHTDFKWQPRFHDHIIRNAQSFETIQKYITNKPLNWKKDKFYV
ncbi:MAG: transposase [Saprospiraceae bacterium]|uniref:Transposase n=1 Tax=Candidatus Defluviibacterium haderslevense TaxID=2981993 RepID=A0A9D7XJA2_9BACT|nr:transposase [Candidatus Defluviibacterium haderslevense]